MLICASLQIIDNIHFFFLCIFLKTFNLIPSMSAIENVELPMILAGLLSAQQRRERAKELLDRVGMGDRLGHKPSMLSGGEQVTV